MALPEDIAAHWRSLQQGYASQLILEDDVPWVVGPRDHPSALKYVGGLDISFYGDQGAQTGLDRAVVALVVLDFATLEVVHERLEEVVLEVPYVPGFLGFREWPSYHRVLQAVRGTPYDPQVVMVDGFGVLHHQGCGSASQLGLLAGYPAIGVAKSLLAVDGLLQDPVDAALAAALPRPAQKGKGKPGGGHAEASSAGDEGAGQGAPAAEGTDVDKGKCQRRPAAASQALSSGSQAGTESAGDVHAAQQTDGATEESRRAVGQEHGHRCDSSSGQHACPSGCGMGCGGGAAALVGSGGSNGGCDGNSCVHNGGRGCGAHNGGRRGKAADAGSHANASGGGGTVEAGSSASSSGGGALGSETSGGGGGMAAAATGAGRGSGAAGGAAGQAALLAGSKVTKLSSGLGHMLPLVGSSGRLWGAALCAGSSRKPVFVSVGHRLSLSTAVEVVARCSRHRIPEPIRQADLRSREYIRCQLRAQGG